MPALTGEGTSPSPTWINSMTNQRFYLDPKHKISPDGRVTISGSEATHIAASLRKKTGDQISFFDGQGRNLSGRIESIQPGRILVIIEEISTPVQNFRLIISLGQAIPKGSKMDKIVREATELGVVSIFPFISTRTIPRLPENRSREKTERWKRIALSASKQSGRGEIPEIHETRKFAEIIELPGYDLRLLLSEYPGETSLYEYLHSRELPSGSPLLVLIGPEGGFSHEEIELAREKGFAPVSLGSQVLRTETVAPVILGILRYELGNSSGKL